MKRLLRTQILIFFYVSSFAFQENHVLIEELDGIDRNDIGNLEYLLRLVLINEECGNPRVVVDSGELPRNITQEEARRFTSS